MNTLLDSKKTYKAPPASDVLDAELSPKVSVTLQGKKYVLDFQMRGYFSYKALTGDNLMIPANWFKVDAEPEKMVAWLYCAMLKHQPDMKQEVVEMLLQPTDIEAVQEAVLALFTRYFPKAMGKIKSTVDKAITANPDQPTVAN